MGFILKEKNFIQESTSVEKILKEKDGVAT